MKSWDPPTAEQLDRVAVLGARPENRAYFFDRLENPNWVTPLAERGFFENPPAPVPAGEPGYVRFPHWPEGRYLVRMAALAPEQVVSVLEAIAVTENPGVTRLLLEAVTALPRNQARQVSDKVREWVTAPYPDHYAEEAAAVALHLLGAGDASTALDVIASLLKIQPDPRLTEKAALTDSPLRPTPEAAARFSEWHYERVIEQILGPLVDTTGLDAIRLFSGLLDDAVRMSQWEEEAVADEDYSYIWRPAIEEHAQNSDSGIKNVLVSAVRDAALQFASRGKNELIAVIRNLESGSALNRRIALYILGAVEDGTDDLVSSRLADRELLDDYRLRHEYAALLRHRFRHASPSAHRQFLAWIEAGPDLDEYRRRRIELDGTEPAEGDVRRYADVWRRDRYSLVASHLEGADAERYRNLIQTLGEPEHPDFVSWSTSWSGPESPIAQDELLEKSPDEVLELLRHWRPKDDSGWHFGPSIEGLGHMLGAVVTARVQEYAVLADRFRGLDPTYVRGFFTGIENALREGVSFSWAEPLALAWWAAIQPFEPDEEVPADRNRDPGWRWCRREIASMIRAGLTEKANHIPFEHRMQVWQIVEQLTKDPNPSPEHEARYGGDNMDPLTLSINTTRGTAMHAVVEYALWCRRELKAHDDASTGLELMPEVRSVLEAHLDRNEEPSLAVRAVYGRWLPWLLLLDERWMVQNLPLLFPSESDAAVFADTAWSTYIAWCPPYDSVFRALRHQYEAAVMRVPSGIKAGSFGTDTTDSKLGEHLVTLYWRNVLDRDLLERYFERAADDLAAKVIAFVGRALNNTPGDVSASVLQRIESLWEWRWPLLESSPDEHRLELRAFGTWFASGKLDEGWSVAALERVVDLVGAPTLDHLVAERLVDVADREPATAARVFARMIKRPEHEWDYVGWRDQAKEIVKVALTSGDPDAIDDAREIVDFYVRRGELDFRELVRDRPGTDGSQGRK